MKATDVSEPDRRLLATALFRLFEHWEVAEHDQLALLGMAPEDSAALRAMRSTGVLAPSQPLVERTRSLLQLYRYLGMLYPERRELGKRWMTTGNIRLEGLSPLQRIQAGGAGGIKAVAALLEEQLF